MPRSLRYCPVCVTEDREAYGEAYWHRLHQVPCVEVCPLHNVFLEESKLRARDRRTRHQYVAAQSILLDQPARPLEPGKEEHILLLNLTRDIEWLLQRNIVAGPEILQRRYLNLLAQQGLATYGGRVRNKQLKETFTKMYCPEMLMRFGCPLALDSEHSWLQRLVRKPRGAQPPVGQLLLIRLLGYTAEAFFSRLTPESPFGDGPWPCLNRAAPHYRERRIHECRITVTKDRGRLVGTLTCSCGFSYSRSGHDHTPEDLLRYHRILSYGPAWEESLCRSWMDPDISLRELSRRLGVDPRTIHRQAVCLRLSSKRPGSHQQLEHPQLAQEISHRPHKSKMENREYRAAWLAAAAMNQEASKTRLRRELPHVYAWLRRNDRQWLDEHSPLPRKPRVCTSRVDWEKRDCQLAHAVTSSGKHLRQQLGRPVLITRTAIGRDIGHLALLHKHLDKLPKTAEALSAQVETRESFAVRRIYWAGEMFCLKGIMPKLWDLKRHAALRFDTIVSPLIEEALLTTLRDLQARLDLQHREAQAC